MLTKDLIKFTIRKGAIHPRYIDPRDPELLAVAEDLIEVCNENIGATRDEVSVLCSQTIDASPCEAVISRGFEKLLMDRCIFEEPTDEELPETRQHLFALTSQALAKQDFETVDDYYQWLETQGQAQPAELGAQIYSDLPGQHPLITFKSITPENLLHAYNRSQIQWLLLHADTLEVQLPKVKAGAMRQLFKYLRFNQLLAEITKQGRSYQLRIDGPLNMFLQSKRYGMNLARFFPAILLQDQWSMTCEISINTHRKGKLSLDQSSGLQPPPTRFHAYIPKEIKEFEKRFKQKCPQWQFKSVDFIPLKGDALCFPDYTLIHQETKAKISLELFHRWHAGPLKIRLRQVDEEDGAPLIMGVDHSLAKDPLIKSLLEDSDYFQKHGFTYRDIPPVTRLIDLLSGYTDSV